MPARLVVFIQLNFFLVKELRSYRFARKLSHHLAINHFYHSSEPWVYGGESETKIRMEDETSDGVPLFVVNDGGDGVIVVFFV